MCLFSVSYARDEARFSCSGPLPTSQARLLQHSKMLAACMKGGKADCMPQESQCYPSGKEASYLRDDFCFGVKLCLRLLMVLPWSMSGFTVAMAVQLPTVVTIV